MGATDDKWYDVLVNEAGELEELTAGQKEALAAETDRLEEAYTETVAQIRAETGEVVGLWDAIEKQLETNRTNVEASAKNLFGETGPATTADTTLVSALTDVIQAAEIPFSGEGHGLLSHAITAFYRKAYETNSKFLTAQGQYGAGGADTLGETWDPAAASSFGSTTGRERNYSWYYDQIMNGSYSANEALATFALGAGAQHHEDRVSWSQEQIAGYGVAWGEGKTRGAMYRDVAFQAFSNASNRTQLGEAASGRDLNAQHLSFNVNVAQTTTKLSRNMGHVGANFEARIGQALESAESRAEYLMDDRNKAPWAKAIWDAELLEDLMGQTPSPPEPPTRTATNALERADAAFDVVTAGTHGACNVAPQIQPAWVIPLRKAINKFNEVADAHPNATTYTAAFNKLKENTGGKANRGGAYMAMVHGQGSIVQLETKLTLICKLWRDYNDLIDDIFANIEGIERDQGGALRTALHRTFQANIGARTSGAAAAALADARRKALEARKDPVRAYESNQERLVFKEQCFLLAYIHQIAADKRALDSKLKRLPYIGEDALDRNATLLLDGDPYGFINRLTVGENVHTLHNLETNIISNLQPRIQLYKIEYNEDEDLREREIIFSTHAGDNPLLGTGQNSTERALSQQNRGSGVGIQSFNFSYEGSNPFAVKKSIKANLKIFANSFDELFEDQGGYMYADLALKTGGATNKEIEASNRGTPLASNPCASPKDRDDRTQKENENLAKLNFRLKAVVGWAKPPGNLGNVMSDTQREAINDAVGDSYVTLQLTPTVHSFDIDEFGRVVFDINYLAYVEDFFDQNTVFNVFASSAPSVQSATYKSIERQLKLSYYRKRCETSEMQTIKGDYNKAIGAEKEFALQNLMKSLMEQKKIYYLDIPYSEIQGFVTGGPFYQYQAGQRDLKVLNDSENRAALQSNIQEAISAAGFTDAEGEEEGKMKAFRSALFAGGDFNNVSMQFFYISDLIDILLANIETELKTLPGLVDSQLLTDVDKCQKFLKVQQLRKSQKALRQLRIILGPVEFYSHNGAIGAGNASSAFYNLGDVPISVKYFIEWLTQKMLQKEETTYSLSRFLNDLFNGLLRNFLNNDSCFNVKASQKVRVSQTTLTSYPPIDGGDGVRRDEITTAIVSAYKAHRQRDPHGQFRIPRPLLSWWNAPDRIKPVLNLNPPGPAASGPVNEEINYFVFFAGRVQPLDKMLGRRVDDEKVGIFHYILGRDKGLIKNIKLQKTQTPGLQEVRFEQEGFDGLEQLRVVYDVEIESYSNVQIYPGTYIYVEPQGFGASNRIGRMTDSDGHSLDLTKFGLGGYYMVYRSEHSFGPGKADTTLQAKWVNQLNSEDPEEEEGSQGDQIQAGSTRPATCRAAGARSDLPEAN